MTKSRNINYQYGDEVQIRMCIYVIEHISSGKKYIGQTIKNVGKRWSNHYSFKTNNKIHRALRKYGRDAFRYYVIDIAETQEQLDNKESFWISHHNTLSPNGYNLKTGGYGGNKQSTESIQKMRDTRLSNLKKERGEDYEFQYKGKKSLKPKKTEEELKKSRAIASEKRKGKPTWLSENGLSKESIEKMRQTKTGMKVPAKWKPIVRSDGVEYPNLQAAADDLNCSRSSISQALGKRKRRVKGFLFTYKEEPIT